MRRTLAKSFVSCALVASMSVSCGQNDQQDSESKVYGGKAVAAGEWPSTVALSQGNSMYCSGTAITPTVVISAAHCAKGMSASSVTVYVGNGKDGGNTKGQYKVKKIVASPKYNGSKGNDIAYLILSTPLDLPESAYIPVLTDADEIEELLAVGKKARIVGFGERNGYKYGLKFEVETSVVKSISTGMGYDAKSEIAIGGSGKDSCQGDSGGPVYGQLANGDWRVYGVTSRGGSCGTGGIYGLMHANICWIQKDSGLDLGLANNYCGDAVATPVEPQPDSGNEPDVEAPAPQECNWWEGCFA